MKKPLAEIIPLLCRGVAPTAAVATSLLSPVAMGASGDLDPTFGDVGRVTPEALDFRGPAYSVEALEDGSSLLAGGHVFFSRFNFYYAFDYADEGFEGHLGTSGSLDSRNALRLQGTQIRDVALQSDGKAIAVGRTWKGRGQETQLTVLRIGTDGSIDLSFGTDGFAQFPEGAGAHSVTIDTDGRIVVAGTNDDSQLMVVRLLDTGALDTTFGSGGIFLGPTSESTQNRIVPAAGGGYRVSADHCSVIALTALGIPDTGFGDSGIATAEPPTGTSINCNSMVAQANGQLLLGGWSVPDNADPPPQTHGLTVRLLTNGDPDTSFNPTAIAESMQAVTALAVDGSGSILVGGRAIESVPAALVMRLQATGSLDGLFGNAGSSWIDLPSESGLQPQIQDMSLLPDGRVLIAGANEDPGQLGARPFLARLLGDTGGGPGVVGILQPSLTVDEQNHEAVIPVRRMAGSSGEVSVGYHITQSPLDSDLPPATAGEDFTLVTGRIIWRDGETQDQEIRVPILSNDAVDEQPERFIVTLDDAQGQAGLGTRSTTVEINGTQEPAGRFGFALTDVEVSETDLVADIPISRDFYAAGPVTVTVTPNGGTATAGDDYVASPVTVSWADGEMGTKSA